MAVDKAEGAFRTISEVATQIGVPQHILRYWETRFPELRPLQRAGNRRYYRPADVALAQRIHRLLDVEGYTMRGVQQMLAGKPTEPAAVATAPVTSAPTPTAPVDTDRLRTLRDDLALALVDDARMRM